MDIGSASFKYDMRRLTEILAFPKAWYRRSLVRRVFLGDMSTTSGFGDDPKDASASSLKASTSRRNSLSYGMAPRDKLKVDGFDGKRKLVRGGYPMDSSASGHPSASGSGTQVPSWETLVLFTVNFTKLNVQMNMGNVMGNVSWLIRDAKSEGRLSIGSTGHKNLYIGIGLNSSYIEAKGGIVAGTFELTQLNTYVRAKEDPGVEPQHTVGFKMYGLELRLDFMGTSVLMGRVSGLEVKLKDEWQVQREPRRHDPEDSVLATYRPAMIFIHGDMGWDQLQLMISKSTTVDLLKMHCKLEEFFSQQFKSSKWVLSNMHHDSSSSGNGSSGQAGQLTPNMGRRHTTRHLTCDTGKTYFQHQHHRHWQQVLDKVSLMSISSMMIPLPEAGTVLGGTMDLHGNNISLACFHGINFKAKSWALFSLKEPFISFSTEAQETRQSDIGSPPTPSSCCVHVVQNLNFSLGQQNTHAMSINSVQHESMAMVCRITRNVMFPPQFRTLHEWFHYAFAPSEIDDGK